MDPVRRGGARTGGQCFRVTPSDSSYTDANSRVSVKNSKSGEVGKTKAMVLIGD